MMRIDMRKLPCRWLPFFLVTLGQGGNGFFFGGISRSTNRWTMDEIFTLRQGVVSNLADSIDDVEKVKEREQLKGTILQLGASYDRGFAASPRARRKMEDTLRDLEVLNKETNAARFVDGPQSPRTAAISTNLSGTTDGGDTKNEVVDDATSASLGISPLAGNWRMVWTTAQDVLVLGANPVVSVGAIYQFINPPVITNVIDFFPRLQSFLPPSLVPNSMLRAEVRTKASSRINNPNRVGLNFERVEFQGKEILGQDVSQLLPALGFDLPRIDLSEDVGYFDVTYLDSELLVIRQNSPGGCFVLVNVGTDIEP